LITAATNDFKKDFFKLMNDSVFGKTMEDVEKRIDVRLATDRAKLNKLVAKPNFDRSVLFGENLVATHMKKTRVLYNKPIYLEMYILELSKT
jgi:transcriptional regulator of aromatic amino acid metabolism